MRIIGCDLHARQQTLAMLDTTTGEAVEVSVKHEGDNVREVVEKCRLSGKSVDVSATASHR